MWSLKYIVMSFDQKLLRKGWGNKSKMFGQNGHKKKKKVETHSNEPCIKT